jgi:hypothetical protein
MTLKRWHWAAIIIVTIALVVMAPSDEVGSGKRASRSEKSTVNVSSSAMTANKQSAHGAGRVELELLSRLELKHQNKNKVSDVFNQMSWYVPPPPPPPSKYVEPEPLPLPAPVAPPLPFSYLGRYGDNDARMVVLVKGEKVYTVKVGELIDNTYRVEKFTPGLVNLTYLPLNIMQSLRTGEAL